MSKQIPNVLIINVKWKKIMLSSFKVKCAKHYPRILMRYCKLTKCLYKDIDYRANILVSFRRCYSINYVESSITQEIGYFLHELLSILITKTETACDLRLI